MSDPLSITASVIALLQLTATCTKYLKEVKHGSADRLRLRDELRSAASLLEMLKDRIEEADDLDECNRLRPAALSTLAGSDGPLHRFKTILEEIVAKIAPQERLARIAQPFAWPFDKKDIAEMIASLERLKSHFSLVMQNDLIELGRITNLKIDEVNAKMDDSRLRARAKVEQDILAWLSQLSFRPKYLDVLGSVHPGTGSWLLEHETFLHWLNDDLDTFWCPGIPGAGKTSIVSLVIDHLERNFKSPDVAHAYILCDFNRRQEQTTIALLSSVLQQLLQPLPVGSLPAEVEMLYQSHSKYNTRPTVTQIQDLIKKVLAPLKTCYVVVDALDECAQSDDEALNFIATLYPFRPKLKVMTTSRHSMAFDTFFATSARVDISAQSNDIQAFLDASMTRPGLLSRHIRSDPTLAEDIARLIIQESQGMFLLAKLHIDSLSRKLTRRDVRTSLKSLPLTLDATYEDALQRIYSQAPELVDLAKSILFWIAAARRPLLLTDLQHIYAVLELGEGQYLDEDVLPDLEILTSVCSGLITVETETTHVKLVHYTAQQYLERTQAEEIYAAEQTLAESSISYLRLSNFASGICCKDESMRKRLDEYPFLAYAATFWGSHVKPDMGLTTNMLRLVADDVAVQVANQVSLVSNRNKRHANWSQEFPRDVPALVLVTTFELPQLVAIMVNDGHDTEKSGSDGETALIRAAVHGNTETVKTLLDKGANADAVDHMQETALHRAAKVGMTDAVSFLIAGGANCTLKALSQWTTLMAGVTSGVTKTVEVLLDTDVEVNAETSWGDTALSIAIRNGLEQIAHLLIDHGAILSEGRAGRRASTIASRRGYAQLVRNVTIQYERLAGRKLERQDNPRANQLAPVQEAELRNTENAEDEASRPAATHTSDEDEFWEKIEEIKGFTHLVGFNNRYDVSQQIGKGHYARVFSCRNKVTGITYATKVFTGWSHKEGFLAELRMMILLQEFSHPNVLHIRECFIDYEECAMRFVMELAAEGELFNYIVEHKKLTEADSRRVFLQLFSAIQFLHGHGIIHRDIKPENILLTDKGLQTIKLADFSIVAMLGTNPGDARHTRTLCGTPSYVAPEVLEDSQTRKYGFEVDMWSCGVVLYICLCGFPPFSDELHTPENPYSLSQQILMGRFDYPSPYWDPIGDSALDLIDRLLTVDPAQRITVQDAPKHPWMTHIDQSGSSILGSELVSEPDII